MTSIRAKKRAVIQKGNGLVYNPETFLEQYKITQFHLVDDPQVILDGIEPFEMYGRKFIVFDTETHPYYASSKDVPEGVVRRWVGSGKRAVPQDYPFCISICDGTRAYSIFDTEENNFAKFKSLAPLFTDPSIEKIAHNITRENLVL